MKLILATKNAHKVQEFSRILEPLGIEAVSQTEMGIEDQAEETGSSFAENSYLKAKGLFDRTGMAVIADDSGIAVDALGGAPGIYSARYGGPGLTDAERTALLLKEMESVPDGERGAQFVCAITLIASDGQVYSIVDECPGIVGRAPRGENGFGYDPVFMIGERSFSELSPAEKDAVSHRGKALRRLRECLTGILSAGKEEGKEIEDGIDK